MTREDCDIQRKLKVLRHAGKTGHAARTCRYFGVGRPSVYRGKTIQVQSGEAGLFNAKLIQKNPAKQTPPKIERYHRSAQQEFMRHSGVSWNVAGTSFCGPFGPWIVKVSAFVHGMEMAEIRHFLKIRVPGKDSNL